MLAAVVFLAPATAESKEFSRQILLVGNSLVRGVKRPLKKIFNARAEVVRIKSAAPGIRDLQWHASAPRTAKIIAGKPEKGKQWDLVFLQQKSIGLMEEDGGYDAVRLLNQKIGAAGATTFLFMTWRERFIDPLSPLWDALRGEPGDSIGYVPIAFEIDAPVSPIGWAIREARLQLGSPPPFDLYKGGKGRHLSKAGQYLAACVLFATITGESPRGEWAPERLGPQVTDFLQTVAEQTVFTDPAQWNLPFPPAP